MRIAMRDLELRGAGDILGIQQSGHVTTIGFHLYCKLLKRTILTLQGKLPSVIADTKIELLVDARLPEEYVNEVSLRMEVYQRALAADGGPWEEVDAIWDEIRGYFSGSTTSSAQWLYHMTRIRVYGARHGFLLIKQDKLSLTLEKKKGHDVITRKLMLASRSSTAYGKGYPGRTSRRLQ